VGNQVWAQTDTATFGWVEPVAALANSAVTPQLAAANALDIRAKATAAGDSRTIYSRLNFATAGASGEAVRAYGTVSAAAAGTVNGAHLSLIVNTGGSITGAAHAARATFESDASVTIGGTCSVLHLDTNFGTSAVPPTGMPFISLDNLGTPKLKYLLSITNPDTTATSGMFIAAGTGGSSAGVSTGGVAAKVLKCSVGGVDYWLPLFSSNS
jgi:hypothetical protein